MYKVYGYALHMIKSFKHKGLKELFEKGKTARINPHQKARCLRRLDTLDSALQPEDMNIPGFGFHGLQGNPKRYSVSNTGNWRITFEWEGQDAINVNFEDYH